MANSYGAIPTDLDSSVVGSGGGKGGSSNRKVFIAAAVVVLVALIGLFVVRGGSPDDSSDYYTPENARKFLEGNAKTKLSVTEAEIDDMVSSFSLEPPTREPANFQITMTYVHESDPYATLELYRASAPNPNINNPPPMNNLGIVSDKGFWLERYPLPDGSGSYFNILAVTVKKGNNDIQNYAIQPGDIIDLHPTSIMGDKNTISVHVDVTNPKETVVTMSFITNSEEEEETLVTRFNRFKYSVVSYPFGITDLIVQTTRI